jgi:hypothetical protein
MRSLVLVVCFAAMVSWVEAGEGKYNLGAIRSSSRSSNNKVSKKTSLRSKMKENCMLSDKQIAAIRRSAIRYGAPFLAIQITAGLLASFWRRVLKPNPPQQGNVVPDDNLTLTGVEKEAAEISASTDRLTKSHDLSSIDKFKPLDEESLNLLQPELRLIGEMLQASLLEPSNSLLPTTLWGVDLLGPLDGSPLLQLLFVFFRGNPSIRKTHELLLRHLKYRVEVSSETPYTFLVTVITPRTNAT